MASRCFLTGIFACLLPALAWCLCPTGFSEHGGQCYKAFDDRRVNREEAELYCKELGANLVKILSSDVNKFLQGLIRNANGQPNEYLTGLTDIMHEGEWLWLPSKDRMIFKAWTANEPNNVNGEDCMVLFLNRDRQLKWNDVPCANTYNFVCEMPALTDGGVGR